MKYAIKHIGRLLLIAIVLLLVWVFFLRPRGERVIEERVIPVEVEPVSRKLISETLDLTGEIEAESSVVIMSKVTGRLEQLQLLNEDTTLTPVEEGTLVKKGQQLAVIDHDSFAARVKEREAALGVASSNLQEAEVSLEDAEKVRRRIDDLFKQRVESEQERDKAAADYNRALARVALWRAGIRRAEASLRLAQIELRESTIVSPIDGVVTEKHIDEGNMVSLNKAIVTVENIKMTKVVIGVPVLYLKYIKEGKTPVKVSVDAYPGKTFHAFVSSIYPAIDRQTREVQVEIDLDNRDGLLKPGMFARVEIFVVEKEVLAIPRDCLLHIPGTATAYVFIVSDGKAERRNVRTGIKAGNLVEVLEGLEPGDRVVIAGQGLLKTGTAVKIKASIEGKPEE